MYLFLTMSSHFQVRTERAPASSDVGGNSALHSRGRLVRHLEFRLSRLRYEHCSAVRRQREPRHQCHHLHVLDTNILRFSLFGAVEPGLSYTRLYGPPDGSDCKWLIDLVPLPFFLLFARALPSYHQCSYVCVCVCVLETTSFLYTYIKHGNRPVGGKRSCSFFFIRYRMQRKNLL